MYLFVLVNLFFIFNRTNVCGGSTPHGDNNVYSSRNPHSMSESLPVPSVGSPPSMGQSPMPNSTLSQPTSVPPVDQVINNEQHISI